MRLQGITWTIEQHRQLIKRMEPLTEENDKLKEAMNLLEKNIQRAQRERDLAESNARGLEYQKGVLSEQLAAPPRGSVAAQRVRPCPPMPQGLPTAPLAP